MKGPGYQKTGGWVEELVRVGRKSPPSQRGETVETLGSKRVQGKIVGRAGVEGGVLGKESQVKVCFVCVQALNENTVSVRGRDTQDGTTSLRHE